MQFLKRHYEKIILCVVLLGLAAAAVWMGSAITEAKTEMDTTGGGSELPHKGKPMQPIDLTADMLALAQVTNSPPVVLSGDHNLFNPVTWRRKTDGTLLKILKTGPDALTIITNTPLYSTISYDHSSGSGVYVFLVQQHSSRETREYVKKGEKPKSGLYIIRDVKGDPDNPTEIDLEIPETQEMVSVSKDHPFRRVDSYTVDLRYDPETRTLLKQHVNDILTLDNEPYKIIEITNDAVRVQSINTTKVTTIKMNGNP